VLALGDFHGSARRPLCQNRGVVCKLHRLATMAPSSRWSCGAAHPPKLEGPNNKEFKHGYTGWTG
jgi:hypothetical protein